MLNLTKANLTERKFRIGFTLVELMVAFALIILMLSIMSQAFVIATNTMQGLKELADMQEKIRPVISMLMRDLGAYHFEGTKKLSDPNFWDNGPPQEGYFFVRQDMAFEPLVLPTYPKEFLGFEGESKGVSYRRSGAYANHMLAFTVKSKAKSPDDFFQISHPYINPNIPTNPNLTTYLFLNSFFANNNQGIQDFNVRRFDLDQTKISSDWAEVAYFLGPHDTITGTVKKDGDTEGKNLAPLPYFNLYRRHKLVLPNHNISNFEISPVDVSQPVDTSKGIQNNPNIQNYNPTYGTLLNYDVFSELSYYLNNYSTRLDPLSPNSFEQAKLRISFNKPSDLTVPYRRLGNKNVDLLGTVPPNKPVFSEYADISSKAYTDIILTNVVSFDVRLLTDNQFDYEDLFSISNRAPYNSHLSYQNYAPSVVFDTWSKNQGGLIGYSNTSGTKILLPTYDFGVIDSTTAKWKPTTNTKQANTIPFWNWNNGSGLNIKAIQISIRLWDQKSNSAKMFVIVQKL